MINHEINRLINFGLQQGLISEEDKIYTSNMLIGLLKLTLLLLILTNPS